jgi:DNA-binding beta-propeller fold protein YncE
VLSKRTIYRFHRPRHCISSDGTHVWVTAFAENTVSEINAPNDTLNQTIPGGAGNGDLDGVSSDGTHVWVANYLQAAGESHLIEITPDPTTSVLVPSSGAKVSGPISLDASATNAASVEFWIAGGSYGYGKVIGTATPTLYGWIYNWNTTRVANGSYLLLSDATGPGWTTYSSAAGITVDN